MQQSVSGESARAAREGLRLSQAEVAQSVGINRMYYSLFEAGRYLLDGPEQQRLIACLGERIAPAPLPSADSPPQPPATRNAESAAPRRPQNGRRQDQPGALRGAGLGQRPAAAPTAPVPSALMPDAATLPVLPLDRVALAEGALDLLADAVAEAEHPRASRHVAATVTATLEQLAGLDYDELLAVIEARDVAGDGLLPIAEFTEVPLAEKECWEARAAGVLVCAALYGDEWEGADCGTFERIKGGLLERDTEGVPWKVRERRFLEGSGDEPCSRYRCDLAPYLVRAAQERSAPALAPAAR